MREVKCYECGKTYDYDDDGFCPRCGAFNQPGAGRAWRGRGAAPWQSRRPEAERGKPGPGKGWRAARGGSGAPCGPC